MAGEAGLERSSRIWSGARPLGRMPSTDVKWNGTNGQQQELYVYHGCRFTDSAAVIQRLQQAPDLLPIGSFIH
jgi:hypothetical protein